MAKAAKTIYVCSQCGYESPKWYGRCPECGEWNTFSEEMRQAPAKAPSASVPLGSVAPAGYNPNDIMKLEDVDSNDEVRYHTGISELDRVLGGGIVRGSLVLLGGDPGIGKSTLLLQICEYLGKEQKILYVSGEESRAQVKLRANRLGVSTENLTLASMTDIENVVHAILQTEPDIVMVDSIQTMNFAAVSSSSGSVSQVRECTQILARVAKNEEISIFLVGHVNKDGAIAGPKVLEHIVDAVLYFEGERHLSYRILRAVKNRYGSTNEIGVFEMTTEGLHQVENPSMMLLSGRPSNVSGTCVACVIEGIQAHSGRGAGSGFQNQFGTPRRMSTGFDYNRTALLIAVLEKRAGYFFGNLDTYINVVGGLRLDEPAADLPISLALISSLLDKPIDDDVIAFGEIGLAGEIRAISNVEARVKEAQRLGFQKCLLPKASIKNLHQEQYTIELIGLRSISEAFQYVSR